MNTIEQIKLIGAIAFLLAILAVMIPFAWIAVVAFCRFVFELWGAVFFGKVAEHKPWVGRNGPPPGAFAERMRFSPSPGPPPPPDTHKRR